MKLMFVVMVCILLGASNANSFPVNKMVTTYEILSPIDTSKNLINSPVEEPIDVNNIELKTKTHFKFAQLLNLPVEYIDNLVLFDFIVKWYGTKYVFGGNTRNGIDCSGFTLRLMKDVYCIDMERVVPGQFNQCRPIAKEDLKQGDLIFFHTTRPGLSHVGFYIGNNKFVHASCNKGVTIDDLSMSYYAKAFRTGGRFIVK